MELKPCPFCGGEARRGEKDFGYIVYCKNCYAKIEPYKTKWSATRAWNRRVGGNNE